jgi:hypothetical protein
MTGFQRSLESGSQSGAWSASNGQQPLIQTSVSLLADRMAAAWGGQ